MFTLSVVFIAVVSATGFSKPQSWQSSRQFDTLAKAGDKVDLVFVREMCGTISRYVNAQPQIWIYLTLNDSVVSKDTVGINGWFGFEGLPFQVLSDSSYQIRFQPQSAGYSVLDVLNGRAYGMELARCLVNGEEVYSFIGGFKKKNPLSIKTDAPYSIPASWLPKY